MESLHISKKVERTLEGLKRSGVQGASLAEKATRILECIVTGENRRWIDTGRMCTKYGEKRIKSCRKYDLGSGYRLITIQRDSKIFVPFLGPHDECQRWLERHSSLKAPAEGEAAVLHIERNDGFFPTCILNETSSTESDDEAFLFRPLTDAELRSVFRGLVEGLKK